MLELAALSILFIVVSFFAGAFIKYKEDRLKSKISKILEKSSLDDILKGDTPSDIRYPNTPFAEYIYAPYKKNLLKPIMKETLEVVSGY